MSIWHGCAVSSSSTVPAKPDLAGMRKAILDAIGAGTEFGHVAERHSVTRALVWGLAYEPDSHSICPGCNGSGVIMSRNDRPGPCDRCHGAGHVGTYIGG